MKIAWITKNRRGRRGAPRLSLFPFLAVLICTMGALVLLLLTVTREARLQAVRITASKNAGKQESIKAERDAIQWRIDQLIDSRKKTESQLSDARLVLGHVEDHARRLDNRLKELMAAAKELDNAGDRKAHYASVKQDEIQQIETQIADAERRLADTKRAADSRPHSFAVVPYEGPNQTRRRPIYIECRGDGIVIQPEGIYFGESDFDGPMGAGNPLAAALRSAREHMLAEGAIDPRAGGEPYPLLLVRPSGIVAYMVAREAMKTWMSDYGYELVDEEWKLDFPPPDPTLAKDIDQSVKIARNEKERLMAAAPSKYGKRPKSGAYHFADSGSDSHDSGDGGTTGFYSSRPSGRYASAVGGTGPGGNGAATANAAGGGFNGNGQGNSIAVGPGAGTALGMAAGTGSAMGQSSGSLGGTPGNIPGNASGGGTYPAGSPGGGFAQSSASPGLPGAAGGLSNGASIQPGGQSASGYPANPAGMNSSGGMANPQASGVSRFDQQASAGSAGSQSSATRPDGYVAGRPMDGTPPPSDPSVAGQPGTALRPGEWHSSDEYAQPKKKEDENKKDRKKSIADERGDDWGLRDAAHGSTAVTRPIHVDLFPDRVVLLPEPGYGASRTVLLAGTSERSIDKLISAVWEQMDSWGIAGKGMYWRPVLNFYVAPGAERRFGEFQDLLQGSGITVQRKQ